MILTCMLNHMSYLSHMFIFSSLMIQGTQTTDTICSWWEFIVTMFGNALLGSVFCLISIAYHLCFPEAFCLQDVADLCLYCFRLSVSHFLLCGEGATAAAPQQKCATKLKYYGYGAFRMYVHLFNIFALHLFTFHLYLHLFHCGTAYWDLKTRPNETKFAKTNTCVGRFVLVFLYYCLCILCIIWYYRFWISSWLEEKPYLLVYGGSRTIPMDWFYNIFLYNNVQAICGRLGAVHWSAPWRSSACASRASHPLHPSQASHDCLNGPMHGCKLGRFIMWLKWELWEFRNVRTLRKVIL